MLRIRHPHKGLVGPKYRNLCGAYSPLDRPAFKGRSVQSLGSANLCMENKSPCAAKVGLIVLVHYTGLPVFRSHIDTPATYQHCSVTTYPLSGELRCVATVTRFSVVVRTAPKREGRSWLDGGLAPPSALRFTSLEVGTLWESGSPTG